MRVALQVKAQKIVCDLLTPLNVWVVRLMVAQDCPRSLNLWVKERHQLFYLTRVGFSLVEIAVCVRALARPEESALRKIRLELQQDILLENGVVHAPILPQT